ncbi:ribbon-helix-helix domain-containing protein, partial [Salmonella sp. 6084]
MAKGNTLQAMLDRAKAGGDTSATPVPTVAPIPARPAQAGRQGTKLIGGHFAPEVSTQLRIL